jgi:hypothetical protein
MYECMCIYCVSKKLGITSSLLVTSVVNLKITWLSLLKVLVGVVCTCIYLEG